MEITKKDHPSPALQRLSQNVIVKSLAGNQFDKVSNALPTKIEGTFDLPKIREMILVTDEKSVCGFIQFELIKLAARINVSGNLTDAQVQFIASQLVAMYPNETIGDFKLCFDKGATGAYGKVWKLDGVDIGNWMKSYLDEKYAVLEGQLMKEKDNQYKKPIQNTDWLQVWKEAIELTDEEGGVKTSSRNIDYLNSLRAMSEREIKAEGKQTPARPEMHKDTHSPEYYELKDKIRRAASEFYKDRYSFKKMELWTVKDHEVFAENIEEAITIYELAIKPE